MTVFSGIPWGVEFFHSRKDWHRIRKRMLHNHFCHHNFVMKQQFEINFDFPVAHSDVKILLRATVELHHSDPYYVVHDFRYDGKGDRQNRLSILPSQEIRYLKKAKEGSWVHCDSDRESLLSLAIGKAIENKLGDQARE